MIPSLPKNFTAGQAVNEKFRRMNNMNMKKMLALLLALVMVLSLAACGPKDEDKSTDDVSNTDVQEPTTIKIGMVTDVGGVNDQSFNQGAWEGLQDLASKNSNFDVKYLESATDADYAANIQNFLDEEYDLIICVGFMLADATREAAMANPDQKFAIVDDATNADLDNVACLMFSQEQASYLVGIVAGMMTETNNVGYVQGMVSDNMNLFGIGYVSGVKSVNPDITIQQYNANSFGDAAVGSTAAVDMVTKGADVIYHAAGGTGGGVISACQQEGIYAIGVDSDQSHLAPETVITSAMKRVDVACQDICLAVLNDEFTGGVHQYDLSNNGVGIAPTQDLLPEEVIDAVNDAMTKIGSGEIKVPTTVAECPEFTLANA